MRVYLLPFLFLITTGVTAQSYFGQSGDSINPRAYITAGLFYPNMTTSLRIDGNKGLGTELGLENEFGFEEAIAVLNTQAVIRVKNRSQFVIGFTNMSRTSNFKLDENIELGDTVFSIGANLDMRFDVNYFILTWRYSFFNNARWNAGLSFGLRAVQFKIDADATVNEFNISEAASVTAPAPLIGLHGSGYLTDRLLARYSLEFFALNIEDIDISVVESRASLEYFILKNVGIGAAYSTSEYRVNGFPLSNDFKGRILFDFSGANLFLSARF